MPALPPTAAAPTALVRPSTRALFGDPALRDLKVGRSRATNVLPKQVQVGVVGEGPPSKRQLVPHTEAATRLLAGPDGPKFEQLLRGTLSVLDGREGVSLQGISLSTDETGYRLNHMMSALDGPAVAQRFTSSKPKERRELVGAILEDGRSVAEGTAGVYNDDSWVNLNPATSSQLLRSVADGRTARATATQYAHYVLAHELEHADTPGTAQRYDRVSWVEEGLAEVLSLNRRAARDRADAAQLPHNDAALARNRGEWLSVYKPYHDGLRSLLRMGGIDPDTKQGFERATELFQQDRHVDRVPGRLAKEIIRHNGLHEGVYEPLREAIRDSEGDPQIVRMLGNVVRDVRPER